MTHSAIIFIFLVSLRIQTCDTLIHKRYMEDQKCLIDVGRDEVTGEGFPAAPPPIYTCTLTPELVAKAREQLQEKPEWRLRDVQALRDMILKDHPNLRTRLDDAFLLRFLRARKFDYDRALQLLLNYHASRKAWPEVFQDLKPSAVKHVLDLGFLTVLPRPDPHGRYILCLRPGNG